MSKLQISRLIQVRRKAGPRDDYEHDTVGCWPNPEIAKLVAQQFDYDSHGLTPIYWLDNTIKKDGSNWGGYDNPQYHGIVQWQIITVFIEADEAQLYLKG